MASLFNKFQQQQRQVQENIHHLVENFCSLMDGILLPDVSKNESGSQTASPPPRQSGLLSPLVGRYIPGYPKVDSHTSYLITRYDGTVINSQPWGIGGEAKELWTGTHPRLNRHQNIRKRFRQVLESVEQATPRLW
ncbi:hypothetical protein Bca4012_052967 [Brassica carinata]